jgi:hypothetical protein
MKMNEDYTFLKLKETMLGTNFQIQMRALVVGMMGLVRFNVRTHCEPPLPAPLRPLPTVGPHCQPHCQITLWCPTASPTAT